MLKVKIKNNHQPCEHCGHKHRGMWQHPKQHWVRLCSTCLGKVKTILKKETEAANG